MAGGVNKQPAAPQGFTPALALVDALPVLFFGASMVLVAKGFGSVLFGLGAAIITLAGCGKVLWKLILAVWQRNAAWLNRWFIPCQISGFLLVILAVVLNAGQIDWGGLAGRLGRFPSAVFFLLWFIGMGVMGWYRKHRFDNSVKANWTAQIINTAAQGALLLGILFLG